MNPKLNELGAVVCATLNEKSDAMHKWSEHNKQNYLGSVNGVVWLFHYNPKEWRYDRATRPIPFSSFDIKISIEGTRGAYSFGEASIIHTSEHYNYQPALGCCPPLGSSIDPTLRRMAGAYPPLAVTGLCRNGQRPVA